MPLVLVSDTSVLVDLQRGGVLEIALGLPYEFAVPDLLFERELREWEGLALQEITVLTLDAGGVELAVGYRRVDASSRYRTHLRGRWRSEAATRYVLGTLACGRWRKAKALSATECFGYWTRSRDSN
jgi:hypothetical protein